MISLGICPTPKESKHVTVLHTMRPNEFQYRDIHQD